MLRRFGWHRGPDRTRELLAEIVTLWHRFDRWQHPDDLDRAEALLRPTLIGAHTNADRARLLSALAHTLSQRDRSTAPRPSDLDEAIDRYRQAVALTPEDDPSRASRCSELGRCLNLRQFRSRDPADLEGAITFLELSRQADLPPKVRRHDHWLLATLHWERFVAQRQPGDLDTAIDRIAEAGADARCRYLHGLYLHQRFRDQGRVGDIDAAVTHLNSALRGTPSADPMHAKRRKALDRARIEQERASDQQPRTGAARPSAEADRCLARFRTSGGRDDLEQAIAARRRAVDVADRPDVGCRHLADLAQRYYDRYELTDDPDDVRRAVACFAQIVRIGGDDPEHVRQHCASMFGLASVDPTAGDELDAALDTLHRTTRRIGKHDGRFTECAASLGFGHATRFERHGHRADLDRAVKWYERAVAEGRASGAGAAVTHLTDAGQQRYARYELAGSSADLDASIELLSEAVRDTAPATRTRRALATACYERFLRSGAAADLAIAREQCEQVLAATLAPSERRPSSLRGLARMRYEQYQRDGDPAELDGVIELLEEALALVTPQNRDRGELLGELGIALRDRHERDGTEVDLRRAVETAHAAEAAGAADADRTRGIRFNVISVLHSAFVHLGGEPDDLESLIDRSRSLVEETPLDDLELAMYEAALATVLELRADHQGSEEDMESAARLRDAGRAGRGHASGPLSIREAQAESEHLLDRHRRTGEVKALDEAVGLLSGVLATMPVTSPEHAPTATLLAVVLATRDLEADDALALEHLGRALAGLRAEDSRRPHVLDNIGRLHLQRYRTLGDDERLDAAIDGFRAASNSRSRGDPEQVASLLNLGCALRLRHRNRADLDAALEALDAASVPLEGLFWHPQLADVYLQHAQALHAAGDTAGARARGRAGLDARVLDVLLATSTRHALAVSREAADVARRVARWFVADGDFDGALHLLEQGRALVQHATTLTTILPRLLRDNGAHALAEAWLARTRDTEDNDAVPEGLRFRVIETLIGADAGTGVATLVVPPGAEEVAAALTAVDADGLVHLVPGSLPDGDGFALVTLRDGRTTSVSLPQLLIKPGGLFEWTDPLNCYLQAYAEAFGGPCAHGPDWCDNDRCRACDVNLNKFGRALNEVCGWGREAVVEPLVAEVRRRLPGVHGPLRLVLVPAEGLALVPWHATWTAGTGGARAYAMEQLIVSYSASGRTLVQSAHRALQLRDGTALLVGDPTADLPSAGREARELSQCYPDALLLGAAGVPGVDAARPKHVLAAMPSPEGPGLPLLHLACHGEVGASPLESRLLLAGEEPLTVARLLEHCADSDTSAPGPLVVLSACETNLALDDLDEAVTLATAFLLAGASSVVGTLWPIDDLRSAAIMRVMHHHLVAGCPPASALHAAQCWAVDERRTAPFEAAPDSAVGKALGVDLVDPLWWAGFTHQGR